MTVGEWALLFGLLVNALVMYLGQRSTAKKIDKVSIEVHTVEIATNSMKDNQIALTRALALREGDAQGRADLKSEQADDKAWQSK